MGFDRFGFPSPELRLLLGQKLRAARLSPVMNTEAAERRLARTALEGVLDLVVVVRRQRSAALEKLGGKAAMLRSTTSPAPSRLSENASTASSGDARRRSDPPGQGGSGSA